jgi:hypothetical protein
MVGRDTEVTQREEDGLFRQIRGLYRHAPLTNSSFALLAPTLAATISPLAPHNAFPIFMDLVDQVENERDRAALIACLALGEQTGGVRDRKVWLNEDVHPRTVSRWADAAVRSIVTLVLANNELANAQVFVVIRPVPDTGIDAIDVTFTLQSIHAEMDDPIISVFSKETESQIDVVPEFDGRTHDALYWRMQRTVTTKQRVEVFWNGAVVPGVSSGLGSIRSYYPSLTFRRIRLRFGSRRDSKTALGVVRSSNEFANPDLSLPCHDLQCRRKRRCTAWRTPRRSKRQCGALARLLASLSAFQTPPRSTPLR